MSCTRTAAAAAAATADGSNTPRLAPLLPTAAVEVECRQVQRRRSFVNPHDTPVGLRMICTELLTVARGASKSPYWRNTLLIRAASSRAHATSHTYCLLYNQLF